MVFRPKSYSKLLAGLAVGLVLIVPVACNESNVTHTKSHHHDDHDGHGDHHDSVDLVMMMGKLQLFMNKLYFSGIHNNEPLMEFYEHEMEETMEAITEGEVTHEGVDISANMKSFGLAQLENFEREMEAGKDFKDAYNGLVNACNACHQVSKYPFIIIKEPTNMIFDNQVYTTE